VLNALEKPKKVILTTGWNQMELVAAGIEK